MQTIHKYTKARKKQKLGAAGLPSKRGPCVKVSVAVKTLTAVKTLYCGLRICNKSDLQESAEEEENLC